MDDEFREIIRNQTDSAAIINYDFVPLTLPIAPAIVGPEPSQPLSHQRPIPGGINARLGISWKATSPILCGDAGKLVDFKGDEKSSKTVLSVNLIGPIKLATERYVLAGPSLAGVLRAAVRVATASYYGPVNAKYQASGKNVISRGGWPISAADISKCAQKNTGKKSARGLNPSDRQAALADLISEGQVQSIAAVASRSHGDTNVLDWASAMFGFVIGEGKEVGARAKGQWRPEWPDTIREAYPQGVKSRIDVSFAECTSSPHLWPGTFSAIKIAAASPKITYSPTYLTDGGWYSKTSKMSGTKVYLVHNPDLTAFGNRYSVEGGWPGANNLLPKANDRLLQFLFASEDEPLEFTGYIDVHNLHPAEFGALLWALFFGELPSRLGEWNDDLRHNIGHLRAFGMGQIAAALTELWIEKNPDNSDGPKEFEGEFALPELQTALDSFEAHFGGEVVSNTSKAREALREYSSLLNGEKCKMDGRIRPYSSNNSASEFLNLRVGTREE